MTPAFRSVLLSAQDGVIAHGFYGREGGVSTGIYAGLNCGIGSRDMASNVQENRRLVREDMGADALLSLYQIHSATVVSVREPWQGTPPEADALVTNVAGLAIGVLTADCVPVLLCDPVAKVVGAAHAGWKGAIAGVTDSTLTAMEALGAQRGRIIAATGPCIGAKSYEVSEAFLAPFLQESADHQRFFVAGEAVEKYLFDVRGYVAWRLREAGVTQVDVLPQDTYAMEKEFYSYRRCCHRDEGDYGRQISAVMVR